MIGAIAGDMIGSLYERYPIKTKDFDLLVSAFTDDTVLTVAVANSILNDVGYAESIKAFAQKYHDLPYGGSFRKWIWSWENEPYNSFGNGSAMRVSPVGFAYDTVEEVLLEAKRSAEVTHNHPEGIKGAQATALAIFMARFGAGKETIRAEITERFGYDLDRTTEDIRKRYLPDGSCSGSVPESMICFLESKDYEDAVRKAVSLGGDADTMACIAGAIAEAFFGGVPSDIQREATDRLDRRLRRTIQEFVARFQTQWRPM